MTLTIKQRPDPCSIPSPSFREPSGRSLSWEWGVGRSQGRICFRRTPAGSRAREGQLTVTAGVIAMCCAGRRCDAHASAESCCLRSRMVRSAAIVIWRRPGRDAGKIRRPSPEAKIGGDMSDPDVGSHSPERERDRRIFGACLHIPSTSRNEVPYPHIALII